MEIRGNISLEFKLKIFYQNIGVHVAYLICTKCKSYYKLQSGESSKDFVSECDCGGKVRYVERLDIVDPRWKQVTIRRKPKKRDVLKEKTRNLFFTPTNIKNRLNRVFNKYFANLIYNLKNWNKVHRTPHGTPYDTHYGMGTDWVNSIIKEFNFHNIRWGFIIPFAVVITLILIFFHGIFYLLTFILLIAVGYLFEDRIVGIKNSIVTGAISFFLGSLFTGTFLLLIPFTMLGIINGAVCGWIGGYIRTKI